VIKSDSMNTIKKIWFKGTRIYIETNNGETYSRPLEAFPILKEATSQQRNQYTIGKDKTDIRWENLDEDIHINSFFDATEPDYDNNIAKALSQFPEINISALANQIGINKSLLAKYIYGIKKPTATRKKEIENALHTLGEKLLTVEL
jgi:ribosome-binding protein aMBF1 (putative translation factor)